MPVWKCTSYFALLMKFWLCSAGVIVGSWPCESERFVQSAISYRAPLPLAGDPIEFSYNDPIIIQHPCGEMFKGGIGPAVYLGEQVFISFDNFESSLMPLAIPKEFGISPARATAAAFIQTTRLMLVVNRQVLLFFYDELNLWKRPTGIDYPVNELSNYLCCYSSKTYSCHDTSAIVLAFDSGDLVEDSHIFFSLDGGYLFQPLLSRPQRNAVLLDAYYFASTSQIGMLLGTIDDIFTSTYFIYGDFNDMGNETSTTFELPLHKRVQSLLPPGMKGFLLFWNEDNLFFSPNNGQTTEEIKVISTDSYPKETFPSDYDDDDGICFVAASRTEVAVLTKYELFYGSMNMDSNKMVHLGRSSINTTYATEHCEALIFQYLGTLSIIHPVHSKESEYYHFQKCIINVQDTLMNVRPPLPSCPVELFSATFHDRIFYIDVKQELHFNVTFVPKPGTGAHPYVIVSNPHVLAFQAHVVQENYTYDGNPEYIVRIKLMEQQFSGMADQGFQSNSVSGKWSTFTVDIYNKGIFCADMHPLTALVAVDCPPKKHIKIMKTTTACSKGLFEKRLLQNFTYMIDGSAYDPSFYGRKNLTRGDLNASYNYNSWGCPLLLYYDIPWLPHLELWEDDKFIEYVSADFVLYEIHGMYNYDYLLTEEEANCLSKAQSWTNQLAKDPAGVMSDSIWSIHNYESCKEAKGNESLPSASSKYQVLNMNEGNRILFEQYNGIYVFKAIVVGRLYTYCELSTVFSVYVHGALPKSEVNPEKTLVSFLVLIFGSILMVYYFPKLLKENARMKSVWT